MYLSLLYFIFNLVFFIIISNLTADLFNYKIKNICFANSSNHIEGLLKIILHYILLLKVEIRLDFYLYFFLLVYQFFRTTRVVRKALHSSRLVWACIKNMDLNTPPTIN